MRHHLLLRVVFFALGVLLLYAPFALLVRLLFWATGEPLVADAHRLCLRMPVEWLSQPWKWSSLANQPLFLLGLLLLPVLSFFLSPLFCGWLCPAGIFPELHGRLVPNRLKLQLAGRLDPAPVRYGVLAGMLLSPFVVGYVCCTFCNFSAMQSLVLAATGDLAALGVWASFTVTAQPTASSILPP